jgi:hypothetical protein
MKQTAVDWLVQELSKKGDYGLSFYLEHKDEIIQAKEMEKEQMVDFAFKYGDLTTRQIADSFDKEYKTNEK